MFTLEKINFSKKFIIFHLKKFKNDEQIKSKIRKRENDKDEKKINYKTEKSEKTSYFLKSLIKLIEP